MKALGGPFGEKHEKEIQAVEISSIAGWGNPEFKHRLHGLERLGKA
jgi:hypothetical protein